MRPITKTLTDLDSVRESLHHTQHHSADQLRVMRKRRSKLLARVAQYQTRIRSPENQMGLF